MKKQKSQPAPMPLSPETAPPPTDKKSFLDHAIEFVNSLSLSFKNVLRSSKVSLLILGIIFMSLFLMAQAYTMMVDMVEYSKFSLLLSFFFVNVLALVLSHYPVYSYYSKNLNNSYKYTKWFYDIPLKRWFWPFNKLYIYYYITKRDIGYTPDVKANTLRYLIGYSIHCLWILYIIRSFEPNLIFEDFSLGWFRAIVGLVLVATFVYYVHIKNRLVTLSHIPSKASGRDIPQAEKERRVKLLILLYRRIGVAYVILFFVCITAMVLTFTIGSFSMFGLVLLVFTSYTFAANYLFFRLVRGSLLRIQYEVSKLPNISFLSVFLKMFAILQKSQNYALL
ncbi:MAG: hypothetical protein ACPGQR_07660, partial [Marinirhabdus sp.]